MSRNNSLGEEGQRRMEEGVNSSMIYLIYSKNFCNYDNVPRPNTTIKKKRGNEQQKQKKWLLGDIDDIENLS
jgi:hypothetical protein